MDMLIGIIIGIIIGAMFRNYILKIYGYLINKL